MSKTDWLEEVNRIIQGNLKRNEHFYDDPNQPVEKSRGHASDRYWSYPTLGTTNIGKPKGAYMPPKGIDYERTGYCEVCSKYHAKLGDLLGRGPVYDPEHPSTLPSTHVEVMQEEIKNLRAQVEELQRPKTLAYSVGLKCNKCGDPATLQVKTEGDKIKVRLKNAAGFWGSWS